MKGIILAGGAGSRLYPMTAVQTKQLQPIYDKPMIYYPLSFLMLGGIKDILIITTAQDQPQFKRLLGNGAKLGINIEYVIQDKPTGIPDAFTLGEEFIGDGDVCLTLGDNLFYGDLTFFREALTAHEKRDVRDEARVFAYSVSDPERYGVVEFNSKNGKVLSIEEKPDQPKSSYAIPGLYIFDNSIIEKTKKLTPSPRGETEIVDLINNYLDSEKLKVSIITRGVAWIDTGTPASLLDASVYVAAIEQRQGLKIACLEEVAYRMNFISRRELESLTDALPNSPYRDYLKKLLDDI
ncbi:glucose-1-phosphate thymidylyltransferase [Halobacteriovorax marinus]|uniref:Glucose-1-phosphate thymidylyltransferase n=1 Tax=Halobacteriovorax marinus TaxID=97084 RepID=A0A1Y5FB14_9BACT|nr:glucose-1-phosphate thymidylyltransferase [Halobacteriovorax marinus]